MRGQEIRDCLHGCLFAYGALARSRSRRLDLEWFSHDSTTATTHIKELTSCLIAVVAKM